MIAIGAVLLVANVFLVQKGFKEHSKLGVSFGLLGITVLLMAIPLVLQN